MTNPEFALLAQADYKKTNFTFPPTILGAKLVTYQWNLPYSTGEIIRRLELLDEEDVVGCGGFGTVYKMVMDDGTSFAVKRIDLSRESRDRTFEKELEILGSIRHINLVNLRGYCKLPTAKLLIYDFVELGSLDCYLHGKNAHHRTSLGMTTVNSSLAPSASLILTCCVTYGRG